VLPRTKSQCWIGLIINYIGRRSIVAYSKIYILFGILRHFKIVVAASEQGDYRIVAVDATESVDTRWLWLL
jgi:hypothetical protein